MNSFSSAALTEKIVQKAKSLGAAMAGVASVASLRASPSHRIYPKIGMDLKTRWQDRKEAVRVEAIAWPKDAVSAVVIGVAHRIERPELDWWDGQGTPGNRVLMRINRELSEWIEKTFSAKCYRLPYMVEKGGIFLKDTAVMAGLGAIGHNNLVITPEYGPRIRFRALLLDQEARATGPIQFDPCNGCGQPCRKACPMKAFEKTVYAANALGQSIRPGINGTYDRVRCHKKMENETEKAVRSLPAGDQAQQEVHRLAISEFESSDKIEPREDMPPNCRVKFCRRCELTCPVGL